MANQQLIDWIKQTKAQGYSSQQIYNLLIQRGYTPQDANSAINAVFQPNQTQNQINSTQEGMQTQPSSHSSPKKSSTLRTVLIVLGVLFVIFLIVVGGIVYFVFNVRSTISDTNTQLNDAFATSDSHQNNNLDNNNLDNANQVSEDDCPPGTEFVGTSFTYENGKQIPHPICSNPKLECSTCDNCVSGVEKKVITPNGDVCYECQFESDCKDNFHCFDHNCLSNIVLSDISESCKDNFNSCEQYSCEGCEKGHKVCKTGWNNWPENLKFKCIECDDSFKKCAEGYVCSEYRCIPA